MNAKSQQFQQSKKTKGHRDFPVATMPAENSQPAPSKHTPPPRSTEISMFPQPSLPRHRTSLARKTMPVEIPMMKSETKIAHGRKEREGVLG